MTITRIANLSSHRPSVITSSRWILIGTIASKPLQLLGNVLLAQFLGPLGMGTFGLASSAAVTLSGVVGMGLGDAASKLLAEHYRRDPIKGRAFGSAIFWFSLTNSLFLLITLWLMRPCWQQLVFPNGQTTTIIALSLCLAWVNILSNLSTSIFNGIQHFKSISLLSASQSLFCVVLATPFAYFGGVDGAIVGYVMSTFIFACICGVRLYQIDNMFLRLPSVDILPSVKEVFSCAAPFWMVALLIGPITTISFACLAKQEHGQAELGIFNTANALKMLIATLPGVMGPVLMSAIIEEGGVKGNESSYFLLFKRSLVATAFLSLPTLVVTTFLSDLIVLIYGPDFQRASFMFQPLSAGVALGLISSVAQYALVAKGQVWCALVLGSMQQLLMYVFSIYFVPCYLGIGLAWAIFLSSLIGAVLQFEFSVFFGAAPFGMRKMYYGYMGIIGFVLMIASFSPAYIRILLVVPVTLFLVTGFLYRYRELRLWLGSVWPDQWSLWLYNVGNDLQNFVRR